MNEKQYYDIHDHTERECSHEYKPEVYCDVCGLSVVSEDIETLGYCPCCFVDNLESKYWHDCKFCGEKIEHYKYLQKGQQ